MGKNVTCLLEPLTFELIRSTIWNVAVNAEEVTTVTFPVWLRVPAFQQVPGMGGCTETRYHQQDNGFEKASKRPRPPAGLGAGYQQDNGFEKGPVPQLGWGRGVSTGQRF